MASGRDIKAGRAFVELGLDRTAFARGLKDASAQLKSFGASVRNIGAAIAGAGTGVGTALFGFAKRFANTGDELRDLSQRSGLSVEALSELKFAASQAGAGLEDIEIGAKGMNKFLAGVGESGKAAKDTLSDLGLKLKDLQGLSPEQQFERFADAIAAVPDPAKRAALAMEVFGKSGTRLLPLFTEGIGKGRALARSMGLTFSREDADRADAFNDSLGALWATVDRVVVAIGSALADQIRTLVERVVQGTVKVLDWVKANQGLIISVAKIAAIVATAGAGILALGIAIQTAGFALGGFLTVMKVTLAVATALLSPLGLITAGVVGLGAALVTSGGGFTVLKDTALTAFQGIKDALLSGDIEAAGRVLWQSLKIVWMQGTNALVGVWLGVTDALQNAWDGFISLVLKGVEKIVGGLAGLVDILADVSEALGNTATARSLRRGAKSIRDFREEGVAKRQELEARFGREIVERDAERMRAMDAANAELDRLRGELHKDVQKITKDRESQQSPGAKILSDFLKTAGGTAGLVEAGREAKGEFFASSGGILGLQGAGFSPMVEQQKETNRQLQEANRKLNRRNIFTA